MCLVYWISGDTCSEMFIIGNNDRLAEVQPAQHKELDLQCGIEHLGTCMKVRHRICP